MSSNTHGMFSFIYWIMFIVSAFFGEVWYYSGEVAPAMGIWLLSFGMLCHSIVHKVYMHLKENS